MVLASRAKAEGKKTLHIVTPLDQGEALARLEGRYRSEGNRRWMFLESLPRERVRPRQLHGVYLLL